MIRSKRAVSTTVTSRHTLMTATAQ
ncbi:adenine phosphoribosyltransferase, partial [Escherichia coli]